MKITKISNYGGSIKDEKKVEALIKDFNSDLLRIVLCLNGRVRFGTGEDGTVGENIQGEFQVYTSNGSANTEDTIAHTLGSVPIGYIVLKQDKASSVYTGTTAWSDSNIYLRQTGTSVTTTLFLLK